MNKWTASIVIGGLVGVSFLALTLFSHNAQSLRTQADQQKLVTTALQKDVEELKQQVASLLPQWYQSQTNPNMQYWGYINDGALYYFYYKINGQVIMTDTSSSTRTVVPIKTNDFVKKQPSITPATRTGAL